LCLVNEKNAASRIDIACVNKFQVILRYFLVLKGTDTHIIFVFQEERSKVDDLRGTPMSVGTLEEIIDDNHAIVSTSVGSEHYVSILSFVDKDQLEPGCSVLLNHKVNL
jgi:ATP-dependent 26S proteasome regulatory subunit